MLVSSFAGGSVYRRHPKLAQQPAGDRILPGEPCDRFHDLAETLKKQILKKTRVKVYSCACKISYPMDATLVEHQMTLSHRHRNVLAETLIEGRKHYRQISKFY
jgi:hypothetical protein